MNLKELKQKYGKTGAQRISLAELPKTFKAKIVDYELRNDKRQRECIFLTLESEGGRFIEKYSPMHIIDLAEALEKIGFESLEQAKNVSLLWREKAYPAGYPRHLPVAKVEL